MKFKLFSLTALAAMLALASCSGDEPVKKTSDAREVEVAFNLSTPELGTRAYGTGEQAKMLQWAVYDKNGQNLLKQGDTTFPADALNTQVSIRLVTGETYQIVFWAQNENAPYDFDRDAKTVTATYPTRNNLEILDAFYTKKVLTVEADKLNQTAELTRPLAQLNIATADLAAVAETGSVPTLSSVKITGAPNVLNVITGLVSGASDVTWNANTLPTGSITVAGNSYEYLSMTYVFAPAEGDSHEHVTLTVNNFTDGVRVFDNIPLRRNYRTNIVGNLLTSNVLWDVVILPNFTDPASDIIF